MMEIEKQYIKLFNLRLRFVALCVFGMVIVGNMLSLFFADANTVVSCMIGETVVILVYNYAASYKDIPK